MKFQITLGMLGKKDFDAMVAVSGGSMRITSRLATIEGPVLPGMELAQGQGSPLMWERFLAGLPQTLSETTYTGSSSDFRGYSTQVSGDCSALADAASIFLKIAKKESPRNYGSVVEIKNKTAAATDGFRLAWCDLNLDGLPEKGITLPAATFKVAAMALAHATEVWISEDATLLTVVAKGYTFHFKTSAVKYPNWGAVVPAKTRPVVVDLPAVKKQAATIVRLKTNKAEASALLIEDIPFNAAFVRDLPTTGSVTMDSQGEVLLLTGPVNMCLVGIRTA